MSRKWIAILIFVFAILTVFLGPQIVGIFSDASCVREDKEEIVRGSSMNPLILDGATVRALYGYYDCNEVLRGDIILAHTSRNADPIIKSVRVLPGDRFELLMKANDDWRIVVNGRELKNSAGEAYSLTDGRVKMLALFEAEYKNILPSGLYLIFGEEKGGTLDSTIFGPIEKRDIIAKVIE